MNMTMTMTLDGLIRALRWKEHDLAEKIEGGYVRDAHSIPPRFVPREPDRARGMTMTAAAADLQKALFSALTGDATLVLVLGGAKVFDHSPEHVAFPYITFGRTSVYDWSTSTENGTEQLLTLHVWSNARGKKETLEIMECVRAVLDQMPLDLDAHHLVDLRLEYSEVRYDEDVDVHHGLLRFRAVTEDVG